MRAFFFLLPPSSFTFPCSLLTCWLWVASCFVLPIPAAARIHSSTLKPSSAASANTAAVLPEPEGPVRDKVNRDNIQGDFFNWRPLISVPKRKPPISQSQPFLLTRFSGTATVIGWLTIFFLVLKFGGPVKKITLYKTKPHQLWEQLSSHYQVPDHRYHLPTQSLCCSRLLLCSSHLLNWSLAWMANHINIGESNHVWGEADY